MLKYLRSIWRSSLRKQDVELLWPSIRGHVFATCTCDDDDKLLIAQEVFRLHCTNDVAWTGEMTEAQIDRAISSLK